MHYENNQVQGYVRYEIDGWSFIIHDFVAANLASEKALWRYINAHSASIREIKGTASATQHPFFYFDEPDVEQKIVQDMMIRIVDVDKFLKQFPWGTLTQTLYVQIVDPYCQWNCHTFEISLNGSVHTVANEKEINERSILSLPINLFSAFIVGYLSLNQVLAYTNQTMDENIMRAWQLAIPAAHNTFYEYF